MFRRYAIVSGSDQRAFVEALEKSRAAENSPAFGTARGSEATLTAPLPPLNPSKHWCPGPESNRYGAFAPRDFKPPALAVYFLRLTAAMT
jgi:hypothetical protein